mgnify:CR=1 FL=1
MQIWQHERVQVCNLNPTFDRINDAKPLIKISKGFTLGIYWNNAPHVSDGVVNYIKRRVQVANQNPVFDKINNAKALTRISKGFMPGIYWETSALCG